jgi:hypothetical protein
MADDDKLPEAERKKIDALVNRTAETLQALLQGRPDPHLDQSLLVGVEKLRRRLDVQVGILGEACQIMAPAAAFDIPIAARSKLLNLSPYDGNLGAASVTEAEQPWLELGALQLAQEQEDVGRDRGHGSGPLLAEELYLLGDGRLATLLRIGRWEDAAGRRTVRSASIARARILTLQQALRRWDLVTLLEAMTNPVVSFDEDASVRKARDERFRALLERAAT